jgi:hypothetical protein
MSSVLIFPSTTSFLWGVGIGAVVWFVEMVLARRWNFRYSTTGIPVFVRRVESAADLSALSLDRLQRSAAAPGLIFGHPVFRRLGADIIAFRQLPHYGFPRRWPLVRGVIRRDAGGPSIVVVGFLTWNEVVGMIIVLLLMRQTLWIEIVAVVGFALACRLDVARFRRVAAAVANSGAISPPPAHHDPQLPQL